MANQVINNKFTWVIKNFSSLPSDRIYSDPFIIGGCKWRLMAYPMGRKNNNQLSLYLDVAESTSLPRGWRRHAEFSFTMVNHNPEKFSKLRDMNKWFNQKDSDWGFSSMFPLTKLKAKNKGYLVNGELKIVADVNVLEVVGPLDVPKETSSSVMESIDVNGFHVLPSQVESVKRIFDKHPDIALEFRPKNQLLRTACMTALIFDKHPDIALVFLLIFGQEVETVKRIFEKHPNIALEIKATNQNLRTASMNVLLNLIGTLCQSPQELSHDDMLGADSALTYVKDSGFKVDWLEKKLKEVKEKKSGEIRIQELEEKVKDFKKKYSDKEAVVEKEKTELKVLEQKCSFMETLLEEEMAKVLASMASPLTLDDVV